MYASSQLMASFEPGDQRRYTWINTVSVDAKTYPYFAKYKAKTGSGSVTEYSIVLRLAEQYLIRAEARNEQGNMSGAISDLNVLRTRSRAEVTADIPNPLPDLSSSLTQEQIRDHILWERRVELFAEGGHRWLDLKRLNKVNEVMTTVTPSKGGGAWTAYKALYPIPLADILSSPVLKQNPGYN
jgi:hypothetical protein